MGADFEPDGIPIHARFSRSLYRFQRLKHLLDADNAAAYIQDVLAVVEKNNADIWINCTDVVPPILMGQAKQLIEQRTKCVCAVPDVNLAKRLSTRCDFIKFVSSIGLPAVEIHRVGSRGEVHKIINSAQGRKRYTLHAGHTFPSPSAETAITLPRRTLSQTYQHVSRLEIKAASPWTLEQWVAGDSIYSSTAVFVQGEVVALTVARVPRLNLAYRIRPVEDGIERAVLQFAEAFGKHIGSELTAQLVLDFVLEERVLGTVIERRLMASDCRISASPSILTLQGRKTSIDLANAYLSMLIPSMNGNDMSVDDRNFEADTTHASMALTEVKGVYLLSSELSLFWASVSRTVLMKTSMIDFLQTSLDFVKHLIFWREGNFELRDPLPFWWLYHFYLPLRLLVATQPSVRTGIPWETRRLD